MFELAHDTMISNDQCRLKRLPSVTFAQHQVIITWLMSLGIALRPAMTCDLSAIYEARRRQWRRNMTQCN